MRYHNPKEYRYSYYIRNRARNVLRLQFHSFIHSFNFSHYGISTSFISTLIFFCARCISDDSEYARIKSLLASLKISVYNLTFMPIQPVSLNFYQWNSTENKFGFCALLFYLSFPLELCSISNQSNCNYLRIGSVWIHRRVWFSIINITAFSFKVYSRQDGDDCLCYSALWFFIVCGQK